MPHNTHHRKLFSRESSLSPKTRICKGLEASFQLCNHLSFSGQCLLRGLREMKNVELFCQADHSRDINGWSMLGFGRQSGPHVGFHEGHTITIDLSIPVLKIGVNEKPTHDRLSYAPRAKRVYICPHLDSSSSELFSGRPMTVECPDYAFLEIQ